MAQFNVIFRCVSLIIRFSRFICHHFLSRCRLFFVLIPSICRRFNLIVRLRGHGNIACSVLRGQKKSCDRGLLLQNTWIILPRVSACRVHVFCLTGTGLHFPSPGAPAGFLSRMGHLRGNMFGGPPPSTANGLEMDLLTSK